MIRRQQVDNTVEEKILVGLIVSDKFCRDVVPIMKPEYFVIPYSKIVSKWCSDYYSTYKKAPLIYIQDIFQSEKSNLKEEDANIISNFLEKLSKQFEEEETFNEEYLLDKTFNYFKKRLVKISAERINVYLEANDVEKAEEEFRQFKTITKEIKSGIFPISEKEMKDHIQYMQDRTNVLFRLPGALGNMIGDFKRDTLLGVLAPAKKGKSFWLLEIAIQAYLDGLKVIFISLEMSSHQIQERLHKRIIALGDSSRDYIYPTFDCLRNQDDTCRKKDRTSKVGLLTEQKKPYLATDQDKISYLRSSKYQVCTVCRGKRDFSVGHWLTTIKRDKFTARALLKQGKALRNMYKDNFYLISYPSFSANISKIKWDLMDLEEDFNFVPDVVCIDYADILAPEDTRQVGRERLDDTWKMLKNLADTKHCLVVTASQSNRGSFGKRNVTQIDIAEDIRKVAHVNYMISLNQTPEEKEESVMRVALIAERDGEFNEYRNCLVLQQLELGQVCLDSEVMKVYNKSSHHEEEE